MIKLKDKGLHKVSLFKNNFCKSWAYLPLTGQIVIHKDTPATNWKKYIKQAQACSMEGTGYVLKAYARGQGIKGALIGAKAPFCETMEQRKNKSWPVITAKVYCNRRFKAEEELNK